MKKVYPVILTPSKKGYVAYVPDLDINTQGTDIIDTIEMVRDAIGLWGISEEDAGRTIPEASLKSSVEYEEDEIVTLVDINFAAYRRAHDMRNIRKNLTLPSWLNDRAEKAGVNFSQILQEGLKEKLGIQ